LFLVRKLTREQGRAITNYRRKLGAIEQCQKSSKQGTEVGEAWHEIEREGPLDRP
jgi:hypothetical protein